MTLLLLFLLLYATVVVDYIAIVNASIAYANEATVVMVVADDTVFLNVFFVADAALAGFGEAICCCY